jgi:hypothetical protein
MSLELQEHAEQNVVEVKASGKLTAEDYRQFAPELERFIRERGRIRMLFDMHDFHGWKAGAMWEDYKFGRQQGGSLERLALVGEKRWQRWSARLCHLFTNGEVRYFDRSQADEAAVWVRQN